MKPKTNLFKKNSTSLIFSDVCPFNVGSNQKRKVSERFFQLVITNHCQEHQLWLKVTNGTSTDLDGKFTLSITGTQNVLSIFTWDFKAKKC
jgi:hypothetical protein